MSDEIRKAAKDMIDTPTNLIEMILRKYTEAIVEEIRDQLKKTAAERNEWRDKYHDLVMGVANKHPGETLHETAKRYIIERDEKEAPTQTYAGKDKALRHLGECEDELRQANARVEELEGWTKVSLGLKCPSCDDVGWFPVKTDYDEWEQQQCEFCYTVHDSIFNRRQAADQ